MNPDASARGLDVVLIGATTLLGQEVRRRLVERRFPLRAFSMMGEGSEVGQVVEYDGEARLVTDLDPERLEQADLLFVGARGETARRALTALRRGKGVAIDLVDAEGSRRDPVVNVDVNAREIPSRRPARIRSPHAVVQALSTVLTAFAGKSRLMEVAATVLTPVSDRGEPGVEELYRQTTGILSFGSQPKEVFERQVAFNAIPHALLHVQQGWPDLDARLVSEAAKVLGRPPRFVRMRAVLVPVFHGHAIVASVRLDPRPVAAERRKLLKAAGVATGPMTAAELEESDAIHVTDLGDEGNRHVGLWIVTDNVRASGALNGVRIAEAIATSRGAGD
jgi:aspartate-semialdehyde dehydrogenase